GEVNVTDPFSGQSWRVERLGDDPFAPSPAATSGPPPVPAWAERSSASPEPLAPPRGSASTPRPLAWQAQRSLTPPPAPSRVPAEAPPEDLAEQLFELSMDLTAAGDRNEACRRALDIALRLVR